jgi:hypothetical protein
LLIAAKTSNTKLTRTSSTALDSTLHPPHLVTTYHPEKIEGLGMGKNANGIMAFATISMFGVVALKDLSHPNGDLHLYVTVDTKTWARASFLMHRPLVFAKTPT